MAAFFQFLPRQLLLATCVALSLAACGGGGSGGAAQTAGQPFKSGEQQPAALTARLDSILNSEQSDTQPGVVILVVKDGAAVYRRAKGVASLASGAALDENTVFDIASLTKPITAMAVLQLHERKLLTLDDLAIKWLPQLPPQWGAITIRHLLAHQGGVTDYLTGTRRADLPAMDGVDNEEMIRRLSANPTLKFVPGTAAEYSNTNYLLLAEIISRASGTPYARYLADNILAPAGMASTLVRGTAQAPRAALNLGRFETTEGIVMATVGAIGVRSTVADLDRLLVAYKAGRIISMDSMRLMTSVHSSYVRDGENELYGYGWMIGADRMPLSIFEHNGKLDGFRSVMRVNMARGLHYVILSNGGPATQQVINAAQAAIGSAYE